MNNSRCDGYLESIAAMAAGETEVAGGEHILACADCSAKLAQMRKVVERARMQEFVPPADVLNRAKGLMAGAPKRSILARLVGNSLAMAGARSTTVESFQLAFEAEDVQARLMFTKVASGWDVIGQISPVPAALEAAGNRLSVDESGRFQFSAKSLDATQMRALYDDREIAIPSAQEILDGGA